MPEILFFENGSPIGRSTRLKVGLGFEKMSRFDSHSQAFDSIQY